ncbi:MAG: hypothetical protein GY743_21090, partial [Planctomycetaceae bacterium]|nr:hypothetical protein [Planctomycetaceae bacterium]
MYFGGSDLAAWFTGQPDGATTIQVARLLKVIAWALPSLSIVMVTTGALRGAGDTIWPLLITMAGFFLIRIPLAIFFSMETIELPYGQISIRGMGWGVAGAWIAMAIDLFIRSGLVLWRFFLGTWKKKQI